MSLKTKFRNFIINRKIAKWHKGNSSVDLHIYLGMTREEYFYWVEHNK